VSARPPLIAIVDDDPRLRESVADLLESAGYAAYGFSSAEALIIHGLTGLDLLITDIGMRGMDGFDLRDLVKSVRPDLPVFLITGRHEIADQVRAQDVDVFFRKPFDAVALLAAIEAALQSPKGEGDDEN